MIPMDEISEINQRLEEFSDQIFHSVDAIKEKIRDVFSKFGVTFSEDLDPDEDNIFQLSVAEDLFLFVAVDEEAVGYSVYAQIMDEDDILDIQDGFNPVDLAPSPFLTRVRHSADD